MTLEYYTYTQGAAIQKALNAIATFFVSQSFASMMSISLMIGAAMTYAYFVATRNPKHIYIWAIVFALVPSMLIKQTVTMQVIDKTEPTAGYSVANVPYLIALPTWFFSTMMVGTADAIESIFTTTDDERYGRTGMMFGSELYQLSRQSDLKDVALRRLWNDFFQNCIIGDIQINKKYTWNALMNAPDTFAFLDTKNMSPLRGVILNDLNQTFKTCEEVYPDIKAKFTTSAAIELDLIATYLHGDKASTYKAHVKNAMSNSYQKFIGISNNAVDVLKHNMAMNAMRYSINTLDPSASAMNYAYTSNKMQQTSMWATLGMQAREFIPMLHTMLFTLFSCLGFMVAAAALIPELTKMVLTNYIKTFAYLATWPALFAILNAIMTWTLESHSSATANPMRGLSLSNSNAIDELHMRYGYMAGFLMMTIPVLAGKILQGGVAAAQAMNYQLAGMINSTNARVSAASSTGNMDFGNLQMQNHSLNNTSANKFDDNMLLRTGMNTAQQRDGSSITSLQNEDGRRLYNAQEAESKPLWQAQASNMLQNSVNDQYSDAKTAQTQNMNSFNDSFSKGFQQSDRWNDNWSKNRSYGDGQTMSTEGQISQSHSKMDSAIQSVSETMGWTHDQAQAYVAAKNAGVEVGTPKFFGTSAKAGASWSEEDRESFSHMNAEQKQALAQATSQYSEGATEMQRAGRTLDAKENRSEVEQYAHDFAINAQRTQQTAAAVNESNAQVDSLSHMQSRLKNDTVNFSASAITGFQQYLEKSTLGDPKEVARLMNASQPEDMQDVRRAFEDYTRTDGFQEQYGVNTSKASLNELKSLYQPKDLGQTPTLTPEQTTMANTGAEQSLAKTQEVAADMFKVNESGELFVDSTYHNVKGNALLYAGHLQNEVQTAPTPTVEGNHGVQKKVEAEVDTTPIKSTEVANYPAAGYPLMPPKDNG
ncbi:conjugal transfer protein TraG N-terminal domain-containing protein [Vibrio splendidus]|uniref:conjugal transfer protein TraG N-terminal domain-containing protein n=1 Tax=Vibrio splendidus TaxID=29497 RepID=UPI000C843814|nr:conjugal transfer protein TraG N-terminal domain-containing protein [Vibrio splendidus]PMP37131.1 conjugal transfer protein TraG [Vibrio splendidus]